MLFALDGIPTREQWDILEPTDWSIAETVALRILAAEVQRLRAECEEAQGLVRALKAMFECSDEREKQLRALVDELQVDEPRCKQIKPGPDKPKQEPDLYCGACGQPSAQSLWFKAGHTAVCPVCGAEFVCGACK